MSWLLKAPSKPKEVMLLNPVDHRYTSLKVDREAESVIYCKKHDGVLYRFFKLGPGWTGDKNTRFLAVEGNPLVSYIKEESPVVENVGRYLEHIWGEKAYRNLPAPLKQALEERAVGVTVTVMPLIPSEADEAMKAAFDEVKAEGILYEADLENLAKLGESKETKKSLERIMDKMPWVLAGIGVTYILQGMGIIKGF